MDKNYLSGQIGQRLRYYRKQRELSLDELSTLTGVSKPMLGQIERGTSNPTVAILWKIAAGLQIPFASFLVTEPTINVLRKENQLSFKEEDDMYLIYNTFTSPGIPLEIYRICMLPGCKHTSNAAGIGVIKSITVHSGVLSIQIGEENRYRLTKGDAISFSSEIQQLYENDNDELCEFNLTIYYSGTHIQNKKEGKEFGL